MPFNLSKKYNQLLELASFNEQERKKSLMAVFNRDIAENINLKFEGKQIQPTPVAGEIKISTLYTHLTTVIIDKNIRKREFDIHRSQRLHWVKYHIEKNKTDNMLIFSVKERKGYRTYIYDKMEKYVVVLEPLRDIDEYYLLSAYFLRGKDAERNKFLKKYKKYRLDEVL